MSCTTTHQEAQFQTKHTNKVTNLINSNDIPKLLPLPPCRFGSPPIKNGSQKRSWLPKRVPNDPFLAAYIECTKDPKNAIWSDTIFKFEAISCKHIGNGVSEDGIVRLSSKQAISRNYERFVERKSGISRPKFEFISSVSCKHIGNGVNEDGIVHLSSKNDVLAKEWFVETKSGNWIPNFEAISCKHIRNGVNENGIIRLSSKSDISAKEQFLKGKSGKIIPNFEVISCKHIENGVIEDGMVPLSYRLPVRVLERRRYQGPLY